MPIVQSFGALQALMPPPVAGWQGHSVSLYGYAQTYAQIYRTQPNVRTVVDFLARNIAQLALHVFRRVSDTDRVRLPDHELAAMVGRPNPSTTRYRLLDTLMLDLGIYFTAYLVKVRTAPLGLVRLPPEQVTVKGTLQPTAFVWTTPDGRSREFDPSEIVHVGGYNPCPDAAPGVGLSPLETLRRILAEEQAAGEYRESFWLNGARFSGVIERPATAKKWSPEQKADFRQQVQSAYAQGGSRVGSAFVLEDGMTFKPNTETARDSEYTASRKLSREECAAAYHVPLPMVGILEHATFSNIKEQHKHLYQDCLGPWLKMIEEEFVRQLLPECRDTDGIYVEFNIAEKLKGSFEEQASSLQVLVGRPIMTANEGRARLNLPSMDDPEADTLAPQQGGPAARVNVETGDPEARPGAATDATEAIRAAHARQSRRLAKLPASERPAAFGAALARWNRELTDDLTPFLGAAAAALVAVERNVEMFTRVEVDAMRAQVDALFERTTP